MNIHKKEFILSLIPFMPRVSMKWGWPDSLATQNHARHQQAAPLLPANLLRRGPLGNLPLTLTREGWGSTQARLWPLDPWRLQGSQGLRFSRSERCLCHFTPLGILHKPLWGGLSKSSRSSLKAPRSQLRVRLLGDTGRLPIRE